MSGTPFAGTNPPKGGHLIAKDAGLKLLDVKDEKNNGRRIMVRLFTEGQWTDPVTKKGPKGYTLWALKSGKVKPRHFDTVEEAVAAALKP